MTDEWNPNFGQADSVLDYGRWTGADDDLYVETELIRTFLYEDHHKPFIVGTKGSGKSLLLFKKAVLAHAQQGVLSIPGKHRKAFQPSAEFGHTVSWSGFWRLEQDDQSPIQSAWAQLWEWALGVTILTHALHSPEYAHSISGLRDRIIGLVQDQRQADPFQLISEFLSTRGTSSDLVRGRLQIPQSSAIMNFLSQYAGRMPAIYLFVDNQDDFFHTNPGYWIQSSCGLVQATLTIRQRSGNRIQCYTTLRPEVEWALQESAHYPRWKDNLFHLHWKHDELREIFIRRAAKLKPELLADPGARNRSPVLAFFGARNNSAHSAGQATVHNSNVSSSDEPIHEEALDYLLRHTLGRPREAILHGNEILNARLAAASDVRFHHDLIRDTVNRTATAITQGYLAEVGHRWPWNHDGRTSLVTFVRKYITRNIITRADALRIQEEFAKLVGEDIEGVHPFCLLASFGLIGWPRRNVNSRWEQFFLVPGEETLFHVPADAPVYLVHPILYWNSHKNVDTTLGAVIGRGLPWKERHIVTTDSAKEIVGCPPRDFHGLTTASGVVAPLKSDVRKRGDGGVIRIAHLSDFHFGITPALDEDIVLPGLVACLMKDSAEYGDISLVAITGDIAYSGRPLEYERATSWIRGTLLKKLGLQDTDLVMVPGNHDVDRTAISKSLEMVQDALIARASEDSVGALLSVKEEREVILRGHRAWLQFQAEFQGENGSPTPWWSRTVRVGEKKVGIGGFCSSLFSNSDTDKGRLLIGRWQVQSVLRDLQDCDFVIGMMHHPLSYLTDFDQSEVGETLSRQCKLLLRGHLHELQGQTMVRPDGRTLELASGACYAGAGFPNIFQVVELHVQSAVVYVRLYIWDGHAWIVHRNAFGGHVPDGVAYFKLDS